MALCGHLTSICPVPAEMGHHLPLVRRRPGAIRQGARPERAENGARAQRGGDLAHVPHTVRRRHVSGAGAGLRHRLGLDLRIRVILGNRDALASPEGSLGPHFVGRRIQK